LGSSEDRTQLSKAAGRKLKRMTKAAGELRAATVDHRNTWEEFSAEFPAFAIAHVGRFLSAGEISNLVRQERRTFLIELARLLSAQGWLALSTLKIDGRSIAWNYGFRFGGKWFYYQPTFDVEARRLSAGSYLLCRILQDASSDCETRTVDMGLGEEGYKQQYAKGGRLTLYITGSRSKARLGWQICRYRAAALAKRSPSFEKAARNWAARIVALQPSGKLGQLRNAGLRVARGFSSGAGISFLEWMGSRVPPAEDLQAEDLRVQAVSAKLLAETAMRYEDEPDMLQYLLWSAQRLQPGGLQGFAVMTSDGLAVHFCWVAPFEGFKTPELGQALKEPTAGAVLIFDGWTPGSQRGRGHSARCAALVADIMVELGKRPWIFSSAANSIAELEQAGFVPRFSLVRKKMSFFSRTAQVEFTDSSRRGMDLYPAA
jgi:Acetyltransferase (GNAT) domain